MNVTLKKLMNIITPKRVHFLLICVSLSALGTALIAQYFFDIQPCAFCIFERWGYVMLGIISLWGLFTKYSKIALYMQFLSLSIGLFLASYHLMIQYKIVSVPSVCKTNPGNHQSIEELRESLRKKRPTCDKVTWEIFGVSAVIYNFILYLALLNSLGAYTWLYRKHYKQ